MIKKLDILVIRNFLGPFLASTFIMLLILVFQFLWMFIDDLIGKGLEIFVLIKLIVFASATFVPLCLPIGVLFASLISFGDMGEHFELVSIKAAGISFMRFLQPTFILGIIISIIAFLFSNFINPKVHENYTNLLYSIMAQKPALSLAEGIFYDKIDNYIIRANSKSKDGKILYDMIIIEKNNQKQGYDHIIFAEKGKMELLKNNKGLIFTLYNGCYYQEKYDEEEAIKNPINNELDRVNFKEYVRVLNVSGFGFKENKNRDKDYKTMRISEIEAELHNRKTNFYITRPYLQNTLRYGIPTLNYLDSPRLASYNQDSTNAIYKKAHTVIFAHTPSTTDSLINIPNIKIIKAIDNKQNTLHFLRSTFDGFIHDRFRFLEINNRLKIEWHKKFALSFSCFVFILIGAALGAIIRKGGMGLPLIIAVAFFVFYYFTTSSLEKIAIDPYGSLNSFLAIWLTDFILLPIGIFLSYKVLNDAQIVNTHFYYKLYTQLLGKIRRIRKKH